VEQEVGRFRRRWWTPVPSCAALEELNEYLLRCCERDRPRQSEGRSEPVSEAFDQEQVQVQLKKRPAEEFDLGEKLACTVDAHGCVAVKYNRYSTPLRPGTRVEVTLDATHVNVCWEGNQIARHERCYSRRQEVLELEHYLGVLEHKPGALAYSKALAQYRQAGLWPESFDQLWAKLKERQGASQGTREMIRLLAQVPLHGHQQLRAAVEQALFCGCSDASAVLHFLKPEARAGHDATPLAGGGSGYERPLPKLDIYDQLLSARPQTEVGV
jgi:hypothetical protein